MTENNVNIHTRLKSDCYYSSFSGLPRFQPPENTMRLSKVQSSSFLSSVCIIATIEISHNHKDL
jgi:hypothetical protein